MTDTSTTPDLQALLDKLSDFLLQSGFAGGKQFHPYWGEFGDEDRSIAGPVRDDAPPTLSEVAIA